MVKDYQLVSHLNMAKVHRSVHSGIFECEGKPLHGKKFIQETNVEVKGFMEYGDTTSIFSPRRRRLFLRVVKNWLNTIMANVVADGPLNNRQ